MEIQIYTKLKLFREHKSITIIDNNTYFTENILPSMIDSLGKEIMMKIDKAILIDESGAIKTPFGITSIDNLSSSCKTVLNYLYADKKYKFININQCGCNALEILFETMERVPDIQRILILQHDGTLMNHGIRTYNINNGEKITDDLLFI